MANRPADPKIDSLARPAVRSMPTYMGPLVSGPSDDNLVRLASNENPLGPGELAREQLRRIAATPELVGRYPDNDSVALRQAIAAHYGVEARQVLAGVGSDELLDMACKTFLQPGTSAVYSQYCFGVYALVVQAAGAEGLVAPARDYAHDAEAMLAQVRDDTRLLFIANPNNPTATCMGGDELRWLLRELPHSLVVLVDQAYGEYLDGGDLDYPGWAQLCDLHPGLLLTRSFSKLHGLAGLRVGYGIGSTDLIGVLDKVRPPFNLNVLAQLTALAALEDSAHVERSRRLNAEGMQWLQEQLDQLGNRGISVLASSANFLTCHTQRPADELCAALLKQGVLVRSLASYQMPHHFRVTVGLESENRAFIEALQLVLAG